MDFEKFKKYLKKEQKDLKRFLTGELRKNGYEPKSQNGFLYAPGNYPVLLCAHLDTVHKSPPIEILRRGDYIESPNGIGGDDRCGIYIIMQLVKFFHCSVLFLEDEEIGGIGADFFRNSKYCKEAGKFNNYIIEFDRNGGRDAAFYQCANYDFEDLILESGYFIHEYGTFSDISIIAPAMGLAAVNLSAGYYKEHTVSEFINLREVDAIIEEAKELLAKETGKYEYVALRRNEYWNRNGRWCWDNFEEDFDYEKIELRGQANACRSNMDCIQNL